MHILLLKTTVPEPQIGSPIEKKGCEILDPPPHGFEFQTGTVQAKNQE